MVQAIDTTAPMMFDCERTGIHSADRERWLRQRRLGLSGSDVAAIINLHPYKSALEVYADKIDALPANDTAGEVALWGNIFEEPILREYARRTKRTVWHSGELMRKRDRAWQLATPDGIQLDGAPPWASGPGCAEVKTTGYGCEWAEEIPAYVQVQVQQQLAVTNAEWGTLIWLPFPERKLEWRDVPPHHEFQAMLSDKCDEFWLRVLERRPPDADGSDSARRALFALDPSLVDHCIEFDGAEDIADEVDEISKTVKALEDRKAFITNRVLQTLGEYKVALLGDGRYWNSWRVEQRETLCGSCDAVHSVTRGFRACRLMPPRKKPHGLPRETRRLDLDADPEITRLLTASLERIRSNGA